MQPVHLIACTLALAATLHVAVPRADAAGGNAPPPADRNTHLAAGRAGPPGYVVGDIIDRRVLVSAPAGFALEPASLPKPGSQGVWLRLLQADVRDQGGTPARYEIDLRYQLVNAPTEVRGLVLPTFNVRFVPASSQVRGSLRPAANAVAAIEGHSVTIAPILPALIPMSAAWVRPDRSPRALSSTGALLAAVVSAVLAMAIVAVLLSQPVLRRRNGPFGRAHRRLRRTVRRAERMGTATEELYPSALRVVHRAFDQTAGWRMFPDKVGEFLAQWRQFADLHAGIERFLGMSQREFFECRPQEDSQLAIRELRWLLQFTEECRARERRVS